MIAPVIARYRQHHHVDAWAKNNLTKASSTRTSSKALKDFTLGVSRRRWRRLVHFLAKRAARSGPRHDHLGARLRPSLSPRRGRIDGFPRRRPAGSDCANTARIR
jgi:hypothetical protein